MRLLGVLPSPFGGRAVRKEEEEEEERERARRRERERGVQAGTAIVQICRCLVVF